MNANPEMWTARQRRVLTALRERSGKRQHDIAVAAGLTTHRYINIEKGETALPAEYIPPLARAHGVSPDALIDALGLTASDPTPEDLEIRAILEEADMPEDHIRELLLETRRLSQQAVRIAAVRAAISLWRAAQRGST